MRRYLPPFAALRAFEAAAKHQNFKEAAAEIHLSASAVSHQIRSLEAFLNTELFVRDKNNVKLTDRGYQYYLQIKQSFDAIEQASLALNPSQISNKLTINLDNSILSCWLGRVSHSFQQQYPDIELEYINSDNPPNFQAKFDIAIYFAKNQLAKENTLHLLADTITLVASPKLLELLPHENKISELAEQLLLHCSCYTKEWVEWFQAYGLDYPQTAKKITVNNRAVVLQTAKKGEGIAIGRQPYINEYLSENSLVIPYQKRIKTGYHYFVTTSQQAKYKPATKLYLDWLIEQRDNLIDIEVTKVN